MQWKAYILVWLFVLGLVIYVAGGVDGLKEVLSHQTAETHRQKAVACRAEGKIAEAEKHLAAAIRVQPAYTSDGRAAAADLRRELAGLRMSADDLMGAEKLYHEALGLLEKWPRGEDDDAIINLRTQLAGLCYRQSRLDAAAELYSSVLNLEVSSFGETHPDPLGTMSILGGLELKRGKPAEAEALFRRQLSGVQKLHGAEKRETSSVLDNLADAVDKQGRTDEAARLRAEAARIRRKLCDEC